MASLNERLWNAAEEGKIDEIAALLDQGADIDAPHSGTTPLMFSIWQKKEAAALYLIERGANFSLADVDGNTALYFACWTGMEVVARELLERGAPLEARTSHGKRPLHLAVQMGHESIVRLLVTEHGAQADPRDYYGKTPLLRALERGREDVAQFLASVGANWAAVDNYQQTALHCACQGGLTSIATRLLDEFGFDLHAKTMNGSSCLHLAANGGHVETCRLLIERGIPVDVLNDGGNTPLMQPCFMGHIGVVLLLLDHGADIERRDEKGWSPLVCVLRGWTSTVSTTLIALVERGAKLEGPVPRDPPFARFASLDEGVALMLSAKARGNPLLDPSYLKDLFNKPEEPIPAFRRTLRWALTSPAAAALVEHYGWSVLGTAKTDEEAEEMREKRLSLLEDDAWERRKHLVIDRALDWGYGDSGKVQVLKKPWFEEEVEGHKANAGAGKAEE